MRNYLLVLFVLFLSFSSSAQGYVEVPQSRESVRLIADDWCPYTCLETEGDKGLIVEVATAAFTEVGLDVTYKSTSWARAIREVQNGSYDALLGADAKIRTELHIAKEFLIKEESVFAVLKDNNITLDAKKDLLKYKIGHMKGYQYGDSDHWGDSIDFHPNSILLSASYGESRLVDLLIKRRIDIAVVNIDVAHHYLMKNPTIQNVTFIRKGITSNLHLGFSPNPRGEMLRQKFIEGYNRLKGTDTLKAIYSKYGIEMPS